MPDIIRSKIVVHENAIHCEGCEKRIKKVLTSMAGMLSVETNRFKQEITVCYHSDRITLARIIKVLKGIGFPASPAHQEK